MSTKPPTPIHTSFPTLGALTARLSAWTGARAVVVSMADSEGRALGNNGDDLMHAVFYKILEQLGIVVVDADPDVVIVPPSGALLEVYAFPTYLAERLRGYEDVPLVIFPSSVFFPDRDPSFMFEGRDAPTLLFLREDESRAHLAERWAEPLANAGVEIVLDHDVVASGHAFVPAILGATKRRPVTRLVAARIDREASPMRASAARQGATPASPILHAVASRIPYGPVYTAASRYARRARNRAAAERLASRAASTIDDAACIDISARQFATFHEYRTMILRAQSVITDRLHVALPAAIMGKDVTMVEAGYFKLGGVYRRSLAGVANVHLVSTAGN
ncbi:hypothetical protein [Microbacterium enclense]|uniref:Polysaccharide pyruvyl transferase domain-containing protein n=1 Tax=Microbacterium enclense TaxID=993073 RepID=A0A1G6HDI2_9MICO|nr:hypothetical protein [Microbacterium enclense]SDB92213.1 hypothetical protein SAMN05216418_1068 [Microbacterium enclense]